MSGAPKFDKSLDTIIHSRKLDLRHVERWLRESDLTNSDLVIEFVMNHLRSHRYPDGKTLQCELSDLGATSSKSARRLVRKLWQRLAEEQDNTHSSKYQRTSTAHGSRVSSRASSSHNSSIVYHQSGNSYASSCTREPSYHNQSKFYTYT